MKDMKIDWERFPLATHYTPADKDNHEAFYRVVGGTVKEIWVMFYFDRGEDVENYEDPYVSQWNYSQMIARPTQDTTTEQFLDILPQVGETVMYAFTANEEFEEDPNEPLCWWECTVTYRIEDQGVVAICKAVGGDVEQYLDITSVVFKEIVLTDEQKAQQEKEKAIADILEDVYDIWWADDKTLAERLYDKGYVKASL